MTALTNAMFVAPMAKHAMASTDFLLTRTRRGGWVVREASALYLVGQLNPKLTVPRPTEMFKVGVFGGRFEGHFLWAMIMGGGVEGLLWIGLDVFRIIRLCGQFRVAFHEGYFVILMFILSFFSLSFLLFLSFFFSLLSCYPSRATTRTSVSLSTSRGTSTRCRTASTRHAPRPTRCRWSSCCRYVHSAE